MAVAVARPASDRPLMEKTSPGVHTCSVAADEVLFYLCSDIHLDSLHCRKKLFRSHLEKAVDRGAYVMIFGDLLDAMQGKKDRRGSSYEMDPAFVHRDDGLPYYDALVASAADFLEPFADRLLLVTDGNHETAIVRHNEFSMLDALQGTLRERTGVSIARGAYGGWLRLRLGCDQGERAQKTTTAMWNHGGGGSAPVTHGVIQANRQTVWSDADVIINGHNHKQWHLVQKREFLTPYGNLAYRPQHILRLPGYKDEHDGQERRGYIHEKMGGPVPHGGAWWRVAIERGKHANLVSEFTLEVA